ncbi:unnamed protein product [Meloidogyne enterolobii]|uniref:Uncharacterized protein n=1 Tax=Meloidogyne enterolobii TaxID=390850 RepID=A0ACB1ADP5_MELEN
MRNAGEVTYADAHKKTRNEAVICFASHEDLRRALDRYQGSFVSKRENTFFSLRSLMHSAILS